MVLVKMHPCGYVNVFPLCAGGITVGYERTVYTTNETHGVVELCAVVTSHPEGTPRAFVISATTRDGTAGSASAYFIGICIYTLKHPTPLQVQVTTQQLVMYSYHSLVVPCVCATPLIL